MPATASSPAGWPPTVLGFVGVHCGLRVELQRIAGHVDAGQRDLAQARARVLRRVLGEHHRVEDRLLWPALLARRPDCAAELRLLGDEHHALDEELDLLVDAPERIAAVSRLVLAHLLHEEASALPVWLDCFDRRDHDEFETALRRTTPWRSAARMVSWLLDVTPAEAQGVALAQVPRSLRLAHRWWFGEQVGWQGRTTTGGQRLFASTPLFTVV